MKASVRKLKGLGDGKGPGGEGAQMVKRQTINIFPSCLV